MKRVKRRDRRNSQDFRINLTSMMSLFSILIVFMLKSFSTEPDTVTVTGKLKLPVSTSLKPVKPAIKLILTRDNLIVEGKVITDVETIRKQKDLLIKPLYEALDANKKKARLIARSNSEMEFKGDLLMQADKDTDFSVIKKIMYTGGQAGYQGVHMVVISKDQ